MSAASAGVSEDRDVALDAPLRQERPRRRASVVHQAVERRLLLFQGGRRRPRRRGADLFNNCALSLYDLQRFEETKELLLKMTPTARRVLGEKHDIALTMRWLYAAALSKDPGATLDELREAVEILESVAPLRIRIFGEAHPETPMVQRALAAARERLALALTSGAPAAGSAEEKS
jgi:hypothetical protein